ncbi:MAG: LytTR family transcriptional regulator [Paludibacteraceae bacterium]|nr:LytTR family transcriptional regulator [Paludibacteraceae bacterium]
MRTHLVISSAGEMLRVSTKQVVYIAADANYCNLLLSGGEMRLLTCQLGQVEKLINEQLEENGRQFIRIGKSVIININKVFYINISRQQLILMDGALGRYTLTASKEALKQLKDLIEKEDY